jgi:hypothetical protein
VEVMADGDKETLKIGAGKPGPGRPKGVPNKATGLLKDAIIQAAEAAGGKGGMVGYLTKQATENPGPFMALLGKVLPTQIANDGDSPFAITMIELVPAKRD